MQRPHVFFGTFKRFIKQMASTQVTGGYLKKLGHFLGAYGHRMWAARVKHAARRRRDWAGYIALEDVLVLNTLVLNARDNIEERLGVGMKRVVKKLVFIGKLHGMAQVHDHYAIRDVLNDRKVVADKNVSQSELLLQVLEQVDDLGLHRHVKSAHGFVAHHYLGLEHDGAGDANTLALTAGKLMRVAVLKRKVQTHSLHNLFHASIALGAGFVSVRDVDRLCDNVRHGHARVERAVRILENEFHFLARTNKVIACELGKVLTVEKNLTTCGLGQAQDRLAAGGLAATRLPYDGKGLAALKIK